MHRVEVASRARREIRRIPERERGRVSTALRKLALDPRPDGCVKLKGRLYRIRAGPYRVIYSVSDREQLVAILKVGRRDKDTYDRLEELI